MSVASSIVAFTQTLSSATDIRHSVQTASFKLHILLVNMQKLEQFILVYLMVCFYITSESCSMIISQVIKLTGVNYSNYTVPEHDFFLVKNLINHINQRNKSGFES